MDKRLTYRVSLLIGLCFFFSGSVYIAQLYRIINCFGSDTADLLTEGLGYLLQALGIGLSAVIVNKKPFATGKRLSMVLIAVIILLTLWNFKTVSSAGILVSSIISNLIIGYLSGIYILRLVCVPQEYRGRAFGFGYALGSLGSWFISLPFNGEFLKMDYCIYALLVIGAVLLGLTFKLPEVSFEGSLPEASNKKIPKLLSVAFILVMFVSMVNMLGYYFPLQSLSGGTSLVNSRAYYAIGLIVFGMLSDKNRRYGAIGCVAALIIPFINIALKGYSVSATTLWVLSYLFAGSYTTYRIILVSDLACKTNAFRYLAVFGLLFGRIGEALGVCLGKAISANPITVIIITSLVFALTVFVFFYIYRKVYIPVPTVEKTKEMRLEQYCAKYELTLREKEILPLMIDGHSNGEIAGLLYISENTVKFHVRNILKKTSFENRTQLSSDFNSFI